MQNQPPAEKSSLNFKELVKVTIKGLWATPVFRSSHVRMCVRVHVCVHVHTCVVAQEDL
jgi:hypothetical protein